jgi:hypothetical protein
LHPAFLWLGKLGLDASKPLCGSVSLSFLLEWFALWFGWPWEFRFVRLF